MKELGSVPYQWTARMETEQPWHAPKKLFNQGIPLAPEVTAGEIRVYPEPVRGNMYCFHKDAA
jgi:hypothetical protein